MKNNIVTCGGCARDFQVDQTTYRNLAYANLKYVCNDCKEEKEVIKE